MVRKRRRGKKPWELSPPRYNLLSTYFSYFMLSADAGFKYITIYSIIILLLHCFPDIYSYLVSAKKYIYFLVVWLDGNSGYLVEVKYYSAHNLLWL